MEKDRIIFGTDGWRGVMDDELNPSNIKLVAQAFADYISQKGRLKRVVVGYDNRKNSADFARLFAGVLAGQKIDAILSDRMVTTPVVSFACAYYQCDGGVMITASHNPPHYNGVKFKTGNGSPFPTEETALVESLLEKSKPVTDGKSIRRVNILGHYLDHVEKLIDFEAINKASLTVAIDSMAGAGGQIMEQLLKKHQIKAHTIYGEPQEDFAGRLAEPVERNLLPLSEELKNGDYSLGLATDGDGDRIGVMTNSGQWLNIQEVILYFGQYYKNTKGISGPVIKTASVTDRLLQIFSLSDVIDVQVGFKYVAEAMIANNAAFGAEESGGFGFKEHMPERDGIFSGLLFLEMLAKSGFQKSDDFVAHKRKELGEVYYDRIDIKNDNSGRYEVLPRLAINPPANIANFATLNLQSYHNSRGFINGLKIRMEGRPRWLLIRISETEPIVRIYAEGETPDEVQVLLKAGKDLFHKQP